MKWSRGARALGIGLAVAAGAMGPSVLGAGSAWAQSAPDPAPAAPVLRVTHAAGLVDGDIVRFRVSGGSPRAYVWVQQCGPSASAATCDTDTGRQFRVLPDGTLDVSPKKVYAKLQTPSGPVDCRVVNPFRPCSLALTDNSGTILTTTAIRFRRFGPLEGAPSLQADPSKDLADGQEVHVTGRGYEPQTHIAVLECRAGTTDTLGCRPTGRPPATTDQGRIDQTLTVSATFTAIDGSPVDCRTDQCQLVAFFSRVRGPVPVRASLSFAPAPAPAPRARAAG